MENSHRFFKNTDCSYYPCHKGIDELNCLFCYCPLYRLEDCPGTPNYKEKNGRIIKDCTSCVFPHSADNYEAVIKRLSESLKK